MLSYTQLCEVEVQHPYFHDGRCRHLLFEPNTETKALLSAWGFQIRAEGGGFTIRAETARLQNIWKDLGVQGQPRTLNFRIRSTDPACLTYTELNQPLVHAPPERSANVSSTTLNAVESSEPTGEPTLPRPARNLTEVAGTVVAFLQLPLKSDTDTFSSWRDSLGGTFTLKLRARATIWKYLLIGDWNGASLRIVDTTNAMIFEDPSKERLPDGRLAQVIRSMQAIALEERPTKRFQLRDQNTAPERVLLPRMPTPSPLRLHREMIRGSPTTVSEIFINR